MHCPHSHPADFHLHRAFDRGWGEIAFEYRWSSSGWPDEADGMPDLAHCWLYEWTTYDGNPGDRRDGWYVPPDPPFVAWRFRDPTDGRTGPVGLERFPASQGWAWDRHKIGGRLAPLENGVPVVVRAIQEYRFHCEFCGVDAVVPGPVAGPHPIERTFARRPKAPGIWRYAITKHDVTAWMDLGASGAYVADSAGIGFGPWDAGE